MKNNIPLPLESGSWLAIVDRDATIISSRQIAYSCYRESFDRVISPADPDAELMSEEEYTFQYHPFDKEQVYRSNYPRLSPDQLEAVGEASWQYYLSHFEDPQFNLLIPGMDDFMRRLKEDGNLVVILTSSHIDGKWLRHYEIPVDGFFSMQDLKKKKIIEGGKDEAIEYILTSYNKPRTRVVTVGDNPRDHVEDVLSIGIGFGLGHPAARDLIESSVDLYAGTVDDPYRFFGLDR